MTVKELKEALVDIPDDYEVVADDGMGMENGSPVNEVVIMKYYNKICMATGFEIDDDDNKKESKETDDFDRMLEGLWNEVI